MEEVTDKEDQLTQIKIRIYHLKTASRAEEPSELPIVMDYPTNKRLAHIPQSYAIWISGKTFHPFIYPIHHAIINNVKSVTKSKHSLNRSIPKLAVRNWPF